MMDSFGLNLDLLNIANQFIGAGKTDTAAELAELVAKHSSDSIELNHRAGIVARNAGDFEAAFRHFEAALLIDPSFVFTMIEVAATHLATDNHPQAIAWSTKAIQANPTYLPAYLVAAHVLRQAGRSFDALALLERAREITTTDRGVNLALADVLGYHNRRSDAIGPLEDTLRNGNAIADDIARYLSLLNETGQFSKAADYAAVLAGTEALGSDTLVYTAHAKLARAFDREAVLAAAAEREQSTSYMTSVSVHAALRKAIQVRKPYSLIRFGDGEARFFLGVEQSCVADLTNGEKLACSDTIWQNWFGRPQSSFNAADKTLLIDHINGALASSDIVGIPTAERLTRDFAHFGFLAYLNGVVREIAGSREVAWCDASVPEALHRLDPHFGNLLSGLEFIGTVSCHGDLAERLGRYLGIPNARSYRVPAEIRIPNRDLSEGQETHFPERFLELQDELEVPFVGAVFLVAAGLLGKVYCGWIRERGGIAIDIGAIADAWSGLNSRPGAFDALEEWTIPDTPRALQAGRNNLSQELARSSAPLTAERRIRFDLTGNSRELLLENFAEPEDSGCWTTGSSSSIGILKPPNTGATLLVECTFLPCIIEGHNTSSRVSVELFGQTIFDQALAEWTTIHLRIRVDQAPSGPLVFVFRHPDAISPLDVGAGSDARTLGLLMWEFVLRSETDLPSPAMSDGGHSADRAALTDSDPVLLAFLDDADIAEGVPANYKGAISTLQISPLVKYAAAAKLGEQFAHCRLGELGDRAGYLPLGLFGGPHAWMGRDGSAPLSEKLPRLHQIFSQHRKLKLLVDYSWEFAGGAHIWEDMDAFVESLPVEPSRVVVLVSNSGASARYARHLLNSGKASTSCYKVVGADLFLFYSGAEFAPDQRTGSQAGITDLEAKSLELVTRRYKMLSFNRRPRWHRFLLAMMLQKLNLRDSALISMPSLAYEGDWTPEIEPIDRYGKLMSSPIWNELQEARETTFASLPWIIDQNMDRSGHTSLFAYSNQEQGPFLESYLQVVTESYFESEIGDTVISEKTCKAIVGLQPFVVLSKPGLFAELDKLGFERPLHLSTNYDEVLGVGPRLDKIYRLLSQIADWSSRDVHEVYYDNLPISVHNRARLFEMPQIQGQHLADDLRAAL